LIHRRGFVEMDKVYKKDGNSNNRSKKYCKKHFVERYDREPNILDTAHLGTCHDCNHLGLE
jgi:hypothetical protein